MAHPLEAKSTAGVFAKERAAPVADALAVAAAASLPWSTSATSILIGIWLLSLIPVIKPVSLMKEIMTPGGGLPVLTWLFAAVGMSWADASWGERFDGLGGFHKLLAIPLLLAQFRGREEGKRVFAGFLISCTLLLALSFVFWLWSLSWRWGRSAGVPVKDYIAQSGEFVLCAFALLPLMLAARRGGRPLLACGLGLLAFLFLANVGFIATGRTTLVVIAVLVLMFGFREFGWKGGTGVILAAGMLTILVWVSSPYLRTQVSEVWGEVARYRSENVATRAGERLEYWKKSVQFIAAAPVTGHGTGSIPELFRRAAVGQTGVSAFASVNPHNQTLVVAIQLGLFGVALLYAMWAAQLLLFRGNGSSQWIGLVVVAQNIVASLFNSHLSDFAQGWTYVLGVGVAGGMVLRPKLRTPAYRRPAKESAM